MIEQQLALFDYNSLDLETRVVVQQRTTEIKSLMKRAAQDIIEIGQKLIEVKARLGHGQFGFWLETEFDWSDDTAQRFMRVARKFNEIPHGAEFEAKALYLLAVPSTPDFAREEAILRSEAGETITYTTAKEIVEKHKEYEQEFKVQNFDDWTNDPNPPYEVEEEEEEDLPGPTPEQSPAPAPPQPQSMSLLTSSLNDSWRTPSRYIEAARLVMGGIDLDPASSAIANETVKAKHFLTKEDSGLDHAWFGSVWINPPYGKTNNLSNQGLFAHKLIHEFMSGHATEGIILVNIYSGYGWFAPLRTLPMCLVDHRISFIDPSTDEEGDEAKASSVFIYVGKDPQKFYRVFKSFGPCGQFSYDW